MIILKKEWETLESYLIMLMVFSKSEKLMVCNLLELETLGDLENGLESLLMKMKHGMIIKG